MNKLKKLPTGPACFYIVFHHRFYEAFKANEMENIDCWLSKKGEKLEIEKYWAENPCIKFATQWQQLQGMEFLLSQESM